MVDKSNAAITGRMSLAQNWRRRGKFDEVSFIFPNAPVIPITVVCSDCKIADRMRHCRIDRGPELRHVHARLV